MRCCRSSGSSEMIWFRVRAILSSLLRRFQPFQMSGKPTIRLCDELSVEALLASAGLVAGHEQDRSSIGVEGKGGAPLAIRSLEPQFFHIGVLGALERIGIWAPELRTVIGQQVGNSEQSVL